MRETNSSGWTELAGYSNKIHQFLKQWPHRLKQIRTAYRIECLGDEDADKIPLIFLRSWDKAKAANAQDDFIKESFARSFQLAHMAEEQSFADFYEATYKTMPVSLKLTLKQAEEVQWLSTVCILEYKFLGGCDLQWKERPPEPSSFLRTARKSADEDAPAGATAGAAASPRSLRRSARGSASGCRPSIKRWIEESRRSNARR